MEHNQGRNSLAGEVIQRCTITKISAKSKAYMLYAQKRKTVIITNFLKIKYVQFIKFKWADVSDVNIYETEVKAEDL
jgi:hypothetical protein